LFSLHVLIVIERIIRGLKIRRPPRKGWNSKNTVDFAGNIPLTKKPSRENWAVRSEVVVEWSDGWMGLFLPFFEAGADSELGQ
jgi:hypothetical protein